MVGREQYMKFGAANDTGAFGKIMFSYLCGVFGLEEILLREYKCGNVKVWK